MWEWVLETEILKSWYTGSMGNKSDNTVLFYYKNPNVDKAIIRYQEVILMNKGKRTSTNKP